MTTRIKSSAEIVAMREGGAMLAQVLRVVTEQVKPGMSTLDLSRLADTKLTKLGGKAAFKGYQGFPESLCVSVNDEVVHGIPGSDHIFKAGDIVSCDFGVIHKGMITDAAVSVIVGQPLGARDLELVNVTKKAMQRGIEAVKAGAHIGDIGAAVQKVLDGGGYGIVREFVGHGVGHELHEEPGIPNYGQKGTGFILKPGMTIAIEPMSTTGSHQVYITEDGWTVKTRDGSRSAHFEHTILVTEDGYEILTA